MRNMLETKAADVLANMTDEELFTFVMERAKGHGPMVNGAPERRLPSRRVELAAPMIVSAAQPTRTRRAFPTKLYRPLVVTRGKFKGTPVEPKMEIPRGYLPTYQAIIAAYVKQTRKGSKPEASKGLTSREIIETTGDKPKQVESALWFLRQRAECIESVENGQ